MGRSIGDRFGRGQNSDYGTGQFIREVPTIQTVKFRDFSGGYDASDQPEDTVANGSPWSINTYTDRRDRIARVPGTVTDETFVVEPYLASIVVHQASVNFSYTTLQFTITGKDQNGDDIAIPDDATIEWETSAGSIDADGLCTMPSPNYAGPGPHITCTVNGTIVGEKDTAYAA